MQDGEEEAADAETSMQRALSLHNALTLETTTTEK